MFRFGGDKKKAVFLTSPTPAGAPPPAAAPKAGAGNQRDAYRAQVEFPVYYEVVGRPGERRALANDLSSGGLRFLGDEDFIRNQEIILHFTLPSDFLEHFKEYKEVEEATPFGPRKKRVAKLPRKFSEMHVRARSLIMFFNLSRKVFVHGMQFIDISDATRDEIERFNHYWQLNDIRLKNLKETQPYA